MNVVGNNNPIVKGQGQHAATEEVATELTRNIPLKASLIRYIRGQPKIT